MQEKLTLSERKRADIVEAAIAEFLEKGFQATSMDALSARAGVSKRTVYNHFSNKEELYHEIVRQLFDYCHRVTAISYQPERSLDSQLREFAYHELELLSSERFRDLAKVMMSECIRSPNLTEKVVQQLNLQEKSLDSWVEAAITDGKLKKVEASYASGQFIALIKSSAFWPQLLMGQPFPDEQQCKVIVNDAVTMFLTHYAIDQT